MIIIPKLILEEITAHAEEEVPVEACGLLVGAGTEVTKSYRLTNVDASPEHFSLDPKEQFAVVKEARKLGLEVLAVYHSHPASPARMSQEDLRLAVSPGMRYVIISLMNHGLPEIKSFIVSDGQPIEETIKIEVRTQP